MTPEIAASISVAPVRGSFQFRNRGETNITQVRALYYDDVPSTTCTKHKYFTYYLNQLEPQAHQAESDSVLQPILGKAACTCCAFPIPREVSSPLAVCGQRY